MQRKEVINKCQKLLDAYREGLLGQTIMPEDSNPGFKQAQVEECLVYFSLPMALNYQRNSYKLWEAALKTYKDQDTKDAFNIKTAAAMTKEELQKILLKHKLALQPNKHIETWQKIAKTVAENWGSFGSLLEGAENDYLKLKEIVQVKYKKGFPYLSGEKIFNYWCFILNTYCNANIKNSKYIQIAPDTHITKCSVLLGVITEDDALNLSKAEISERWRTLLEGSGINPIEMHPPLWFWSRNGFLYKL